MRSGIAGAILLTGLLSASPASAQFNPWDDTAPADPYGSVPLDPFGQPVDPYQAVPEPVPEPPVEEAPGAPMEDPFGMQTPQGTEIAPSIQAVPAPEAEPERVANPVAVFSGLDKITGRITTFDVAVGEMFQFGALQVTPRICYSAPPEETPKTDTFVEIDEVTLDRDIRRIFTGWMFADSPGLNAVEHPVYDVWLQECRGEGGAGAPEAAEG